MITTRPYILAVDVGTSSLKAVIYDESGNTLETAAERYVYHSPQPGWAEANPEDWWQAFEHTLDALHAAGHDLSQCRALAFTGQMHTAVLLDEEGSPLEPTILWLDRRATAETAELQQQLKLPAYRLNSTYTLPKLLWLARHRPDIVKKARCLLWPKDYLRFRLTGRALTDITEAGGASLLDWKKLTWDQECLAGVGFDPAILPPLCHPEDDGGALLPEVAARFGLNPDAKVIVGAGDVLALITSAPPAPGRLTCSLGSSSMVFYPLPAGHPVDDPQGRLYIYPLLPYRLLGGVSSTTGAALQWAWQEFFPPEVPFTQAVESALNVSPGADGLVFLPFLSGERSPYWSDSLRGSFCGLALAHSRTHILRSVLEGVAFSLRALLEIYRELGVPIHEIALAGGGTATPGWPQIFADVCQTTICIYSGQETVTRGLYAYACQALEGGAEFEPALLRTFGPAETVTPRSELGSLYDRLYARYKRLSDFTYRLLSESESAL